MIFPPSTDITSPGSPIPFVGSALHILSILPPRYAKAPGIGIVPLIMQSSSVLDFEKSIFASVFSIFLA